MWGVSEVWWGGKIKGRYFSVFYSLLWLKVLIKSYREGENRRWRMEEEMINVIWLRECKYNGLVDRLEVLWLEG